MDNLDFTLSIRRQRKMCIRDRGGPPKRSGTNPHLDIPPHTRNVLIVIALAGMICAVIGSLMAEKGKAVEMDKIVHFVGYTMLGCMMISGLRLMLWPFG